jgi:5-hydroxyisourate hydrolase
MRVRLYRESALSAELATDVDGRIREEFPQLEAGVYRLVFETGDYFAARDVECFYPEVALCFAVSDPLRHHHVPLLLSPFAYSTYRGS